MSAVYKAGADLPDLAVTWKDTNGAVIDFSSGWAFQVKVSRTAGDVALFTKTTGVAGSASAPNLTLSWSTTGELNGLAPGIYVIEITAIRASDGKPRKMETPLQIKPSIGVVVAPLPPDGGTLDGGGF